MTFEEQMEFTNTHNRFMKYCGIRITALTEDGCTAELSVGEFCKNTGETVHGGLLYTMADCAASAFARALRARPVTLSGELHYLANVTGGVLTATAAPIRLGKTVLVLRVQIAAGEKKLAEGIFTCYAS